MFVQRTMCIMTHYIYPYYAPVELRPAPGRKHRTMQAVPMYIHTYIYIYIYIYIYVCIYTHIVVYMECVIYYDMIY